uniref:Uncharacterized protein n=1 Tax=Sphaerodactylus townsendi TaxID=933632 RepID=A0ACB8E682_9SAUR
MQIQKEAHISTICWTVNDHHTHSTQGCLNTIVWSHKVHYSCHTCYGDLTAVDLNSRDTCTFIRRVKVCALELGKHSFERRVGFPSFLLNFFHFLFQLCCF